MMPVIVWVCILSSVWGHNSQPTIIDNLASKADCERLIASNKDYARDSRCVQVRKYIGAR